MEGGTATLGPLYSLLHHEGQGSQSGSGLDPRHDFLSLGPTWTTIADH